MEIKLVQEYISLIEKLKDNYTYELSHLSTQVFGKQLYKPHFIFRGHSDHENYSLLPGIFREKKISAGRSVTEYSQLEYNILNDFMSEACRFVKNISMGDIVAWLEVAQHFGVPTRLLDFTENPLVALYFACSDSPQKDASVWIINEPAYNKKFFQKLLFVPTLESKIKVGQIIEEEILCQFNQKPVENSKRIQQPWIYKPYYHEERMNLQSSIFVIWGANRRPLTAFLDTDDYMVEDNPINSEHGIICYIKILAEHKTKLLQQLDLLGINEKFIYPGIDGIGRYIKEKYSSKE